MNKNQLYTLRFSSYTNVSFWSTLHGAFRAAKTVIWTPPHDDRVIHSKVAKLLSTQKQPKAQSLEATLATIQQNIPTETVWLRLTAKERLGIFAALMQFTMYLPSIQPYFRVNYHDIENLRRAIVRGGKKRPLELHEQLRIARSMTPNTAEALWLLLVTSRQYARWYDEEAIHDMPQITHDAALRRMQAFSVSVVALKPWKDTSTPQDSAGDTYYVWTHAIAKLVFGPMSSPWAIDAYFYKAALHVGTWLNHSIAHKVSPQSINSDHTIAARYGNAIGTLLATKKKE